MKDSTQAPAMAGQEPWLPMLDLAQFPAALRDKVEHYERRMGFLPNALRYYAYREEIASPLWVLNDAVMRDASSTLPVGLKRRLAAMASRTNDCTYCTAHNCEILSRPAEGSEGWGLSEAQVDDILAGSLEPANEFEAACFEFVKAASLDPSFVPPELYASLRELLTPAQVVELACLVGFWKMYNTIHDCLKVPIEEALSHRAARVEAA